MAPAVLRTRSAHYAENAWQRSKCDIGRTQNGEVNDGIAAVQVVSFVLTGGVS